MSFKLSTSNIIFISLGKVSSTPFANDTLANYGLSIIDANGYAHVPIPQSKCMPFTHFVAVPYEFTEFIAFMALDLTFIYCNNCSRIPLLS